MQAADLHVVAMGDQYVSIGHPRKIYNVLGVGIPILFSGPAQSHLEEIVDRLRATGHVYSCSSGEVEGVIRSVFDAVQKRGVDIAEHRRMSLDFSQQILLPRFICELERVSKPLPDGAI
jgi:hypothetical protein